MIRACYLFLTALCFHECFTYQVQNDDVTFFLYTREKRALQLNTENLCGIDRSKDFRFIIHGWIASHNESWVAEMTEAFLEADDLNVVQVDWSPLASQIADLAVEHANSAAYFVAKFIRILIEELNVSPRQIQLIGHSLGAHISSFASKYTKNYSSQRIFKITGMDPANVQFNPDVPENGLNANDADVVSIVHTDAGGYGRPEPLGTIDFYPNGGAAPQPGCPEDNDCSHVIVTAFVVESIQNPEGFSSIKCDSYENYLVGVCATNDRVALGGDLVGHQGIYFFETNPEKPYSKN